VEDVSQRKLRGIIPTLRKIWLEEGLRGYFKGNGTNVVRIIPYTAVQFASYEEYKKLLNIPDDPRNKSTLKRLIAGAMAGITSIAATYPLDLVRTRLSAQGEGADRKYKNMRHCFQTILKEEGGFWSGCLYRGITPTILGIAPYVGINFAVFEALKGWVMTDILHHTDELEAGGLMQLPVRWKLLCGAVSGATAQSVSYPLDVIRRRMQMKGQQAKFAYSSTSDAVITIVKSEGITGLYKGITPNLIKVAPSMAIAFVTYEFVKAGLFGVPIKFR
jgi:solute carrier family 25 phosphate transporter 23/24/25/41